MGLGGSVFACAGKSAFSGVFGDRFVRVFGVAHARAPAHRLNRRRTCRTPRPSRVGRRTRPPHGSARDYEAWTSGADVPGIKCQGISKTNERARDVIDCAWAWCVREMGNVSMDERRRNFYANPSQSVSRMPWSTKMKTLCQSSWVYSFELDRVLTGRETMMLQGWGKTHLNGFSSDLLRQLSGEGYCLPCAACVLFSFWLNEEGPWWKSSTPEGREHSSQ